MRWAAGVEYDGREFSGWQRQAEARLRTVQGVVERALSVIAAHEVQVVCAGRTDRGVHALAQIVHFDTPAIRSARAWLLGGNSQLPSDASFTWFTPVDEDFNARFGALSRRYRYLVFNGPARSALWSGRAAMEPVRLDVEAMQNASRCLVGEHDFSAFRGKDCQARTPIKRVLELELSRQGDWVILDIEAVGFLHNMVRNITGTLLAVGRGRKPEAWVADVLASRDRCAAGENAPPGGLYFMQARYPSRYILPERRNDGIPL